MSEYVIVESGDLAERGAPNHGIDTASNLAANGHDVTVFLVQNGVLLVRRGAQCSEPAGAQESGVRLLADDFSLRERGIGVDQLIPEVSPSPLETLVDRLAAGSKILWY